MAEGLVLQAETRNKAGTRSARKLRKTSRIPVIIYGHKQEPRSISLDYHDLALELQHHHRLVEVELDGKREKYLVKDVQYDYLGDKVIHVDLTRVDINERVTVTVDLEFRGTAAGANEGGIFTPVNPQIELECVVTTIPESIRVVVDHLEVGDTLTASEIELPEGVKLVTAPATPIAMVRAKAVEEEVEEAAEVEVGAGEEEPEIIAREKEEKATEEAS